SDENRGQPIISQAVVHGNVAYFAGITPNPIVGDIKAQTAQVVRRVDELLNLAGTDKSKLLSAQVWIADMRLFEDHNSVWNEWVDPANPPVRACLTTDFGDLGCSLKLWWLRPCRESREKQLAVVRFGSKADISQCNRHVRFTPESGHSAA
ncbi:MAG: RidA family protein, partial [Pseudolabrys sp.]